MSATSYNSSINATTLIAGNTAIITFNAIGGAPATNDSIAFGGSYFGTGLAPTFPSSITIYQAGGPTTVDAAFPFDSTFSGTAQIICGNVGLSQSGLPISQPTFNLTIVSAISTNPYATINDFISRYDYRQVYQLSTDDDTQNLNQLNAQNALNDSADQLNSYLENRVSLPLTTIPGMAIKIVCCWAFVALYGRRGDLPESVKRDMDQINKWLEDFQMGRVSLTGTSRNVPILTQSDSYCRGSITNNQPFFPTLPGQPSSLLEG